MSKVEYTMKKFRTGYEIWSTVTGPDLLGNDSVFQNFVGWWPDKEDALAALESLRNMQYVTEQ